MPFRVLSINGGGMRGIYAASYLESMEHAFASRRGVDALDIGKAFDLIVGTSTGAIIGCGLAKGVRPSEMVKLYKNNGAKIFQKKLPNKFGFNFLKQLKTRPTYLEKGEEVLREALKKAFGDTTVKQIWDERQIALAVTAVKMSNYGPCVFKTPHNPDTTGRDNECTLVDICLASSAAPLFRSLAAIDHSAHGTNNVFTDGGLWANNPVIVAITEALRMLSDQKRDDETVEVFCLGSCGKPEGNIIDKSKLARGLLEWRFGGEAAQVSIAAQEYAYDFIAQELAKHFKRSVKIINFPAGTVHGDLLDYLDLDETREKGLNALISKAKDDADTTNSFIRNNAEYGPIIKDLFDSMPIQPIETQTEGEQV
ncbi:CBASS cGAMP-activated phospholipase [Geobacter anodireducens]